MPEWCGFCGRDKARCECEPRAEAERERDAIELLDRIYGRKANHQLSDAGMVEAWMDEQIMEFIRKHGPFAEQLRSLTDDNERGS